MKNNNLMKCMTTFFAVLLFALNAAAEDNSLKGSVYLFAPQGENPTPVSGYEVKLYDMQQKKALNPSVTDAYGRYAFFGIPSGRYILSIIKTGPHWRQFLWRQEVTAPGAVAPIVLPQSANIVPRASYVEVKGQKDIYDFSLWIDSPNEQKVQISKVIYVFDHPTFKTKEFTSSNQADGFKVSYRGWGCLSNVTIKIESRDVSSQIRFNMCEALKDF